jgi:hypothetical protein
MVSADGLAVFERVPADTAGNGLGGPVGASGPVGAGGKAWVLVANEHKSRSRLEDLWRVKRKFRGSYSSRGVFFDDG